MKSRLITLFFIFLFIILTFPLFHLRLMIVESGSMEPDIPYKSIILVQEIASDDIFENIHIGDDITVKTPGNLFLTHRVVAIDEVAQTIQTKGLTNDVVDQPIPVSHVVGRVVFVIPFIGYFLNFYVLIILIVFLFAFYILRLLLQEYKKEKSV